MTEKQYLDQNLAGFENDSFAKEKFKTLIAEKELDVFIETGTYLGSTTKLLAQWAKKVITIEVKKEHFDKAKKALSGIKNIDMRFGSSDTVLDDIFNEQYLNDQKVGLFLDAHWEAYNPLLNELENIAAHGIVPEFIAIHDFKVPGNKELGFDSYRGQDYEWDWIKDGVEKIYGADGYRVEYNSEATGAKRGIIYIFKN